MIPAKNAPCPCGSGKQYKRCCMLKGGLNLPSRPAGVYNKKFNRIETAYNHLYQTFNYSGCPYIDNAPYMGKIKCRLVHALGNSIVIPDFIFLKTGWIQPLHFTAPYFFKLDDNVIGCQLFIDIQNGQTIRVRFYNHQLNNTLADKSQLFDCEIYGPDDIESYSCGDWQMINNEMCLTLFHHTDQKGYDGITKSKSMKPSAWNYKGNKICTNFHFDYFTHIPEIKYPSDLITIAMSQEGKIDHMVDDFIPPKKRPPDFRSRFHRFIYVAEVYRSTTSDRNHSISFLVPVDSIDAKHIYYHCQGNISFYEICFPFIHRIKVHPDSYLTFGDDHVIAPTDKVVHADYIIVGDATVKHGLAAPFEEEETTYIFKIQDCGTLSIPDFWFAHGNTDLFTDKSFTPTLFTTPAS